MHVASMAEEEMDDKLTLCLPPLSEEDPLFHKKKRLFDARKLMSKFQLDVPSLPGVVLHILDQMVSASRILHLIEVELYFVVDDDSGPFSPRNELESLNSTLVIIKSLFCSAKAEKAKVLQVLLDAACDMIKSVRAQSIVETIAENVDSSAEALLLKWGESHGVRTKLGVAYFEGAGRGVVALENLTIGDTVLEIPESLIISEDVISESDMCGVLLELDGMSAETMLLLWSMRERENSNSKFKNYFETLPKEFHTGLSFGIDALAALEGTLLFEELANAKEHLRRQYDILCPALCSSYPNIFPLELYSWDRFLWACELWYSNSMKVILSDGKLKTCLVPVAGLLNHSLCAHILQYGRVDLATKSLKFKLSRPCKEGEQCYLSYGNFPGSHFVKFYGFLPKGDNPYDVIPLDFEAPDAEDDTLQSYSADNGWTTHMVRGTWLSKTKKPHTHGLPPPLLAHLRAMLKGDDDELPSELSSQEDNERELLETILSIFNPMMEGLGDSDDFDRDKSTWDVRLASDYKDLQRRIVSSVLTSCTTALKMIS